MSRMLVSLILGAGLAATLTPVFGQSSSLYVQSAQSVAAPTNSGTPAVSTASGTSSGGNSAAAPADAGDPPVTGFRPSAELTAVSFAVVKSPEPRKYAVNDLVTIVVRESTESDSNSKLDTKKENNYSGAISAFPNLDLKDLLEFQLQGGTSSNPPKLGINYKNEFKGNGDYTRKDTFTTRITAKIIDVKPNGTLVLEARKFIKSDKESMEMVLTGTCRKQDVATDNTVQSTQMYDLRLIKKHTGELRNATSKGILTKFFDLLFNF